VLIAARFLYMIGAGTGRSDGGLTAQGISTGEQAAEGPMSPYQSVRYLGKTRLLRAQRAGWAVDRRSHCRKGARLALIDLLTGMVLKRPELASEKQAQMSLIKTATSVDRDFKCGVAVDRR